MSRVIDVKSDVTRRRTTPSYDVRIAFFQSSGIRLQGIYNSQGSLELPICLTIYKYLESVGYPELESEVADHSRPSHDDAEEYTAASTTIRSMESKASEISGISSSGQWRCTDAPPTRNIPPGAAFT